MADSTDALLEIVYQLTADHGVRFEPAALVTCREIFDKTVGNFARQAADQQVAAHPWENEQFRDFILGQVKRIGLEAKAKANAAPVSPAVFRQAAFDVMKATNRICRLRAERGRLNFNTTNTPEKYEGEVCTGYLAAE